MGTNFEKWAKMNSKLQRLGLEINQDLIEWRGSQKFWRWDWKSNVWSISIVSYPEYSD